ncbi:MAG: 1-(5-phosphoribosyl)-5-[(5-phosphoribosylamino)methylideneamino]imidazole-4-carboxamide isomerase [bacterium]
MIVYPAIDLLDGRCVRLARGERDKAKVYSPRPDEIARKWRAAGAEWLHVVDLNGALEGKCFVNIEPIKKIIAAAGIPIQVGGGVRTVEDIERFLEAGVSRVIVGTKALESRDFGKLIFDKFGEKVALALDSRGGRVAVKGWTETGELTTVEAAARAEEDGAAMIIVTDVLRDGMLARMNFALYEEIAAAAGIPMIASGGVTTINDIVQLKNMALPCVVGVITGKALYEGMLDLAEAVRACKSAS